MRLILTVTSLVIATTPAFCLSRHALNSQDVEKWGTYVNKAYKFEIKCPRGLAIQDNFGEMGWPFYSITGGPGDITGKQLLDIPLYDAREGKDGSRWYTAGITIGVTKNDRDATDCFEGGKDKRFKPRSATETINGITFAKFQIEGHPGESAYFSGISYRTVHNGKCFVIDKVKSGTNTAPPSLSEQEIQTMYDDLEVIIHTFRFTRSSPLDFK